MKPSPSPAAMLAWKEPPRRVATPPLSVRRIAQKSALLNLGIAVPCLLVGAIVGNPMALLIVVALLTFVSIALWTATFALTGFVLLVRIFQAQGLPITRRSRQQPAFGVGDEWLDNLFS